MITTKTFTSFDSGVQSSRQSMPVDSRPDLFLRLSNDEIDEHLADIETASGTFHKGPFSLLVFPQESVVEPQEIPRQKHSSLSTGVHSTSSAEIVSEAQTPGSRSRLTPVGLSGGLGPQCRPHSNRPSLPTELSLLELNPHEQRLFYHYIAYVTDQLSPLAGFVCSAYATIVPSIAISNELTPHTSHNASAAVFHGILGVSAASLCSISSTHRFQALHHERLALRHLRLSIEEGTDAYLTLAVAIMVLLLLEHLSGRAQDYPAHIQAGLRCLVLSAQRDPQCSKVKVISEQFLFGCAIGNITPDVRIHCLQIPAGRRGYLEEQTGMTVGMLEIIININEIHAKGGRDQIPRETVENLGRKLASHKPVGNEVQVNSFTRRIGALVFYASEMYFLRAVKGLEAEHPDAMKALESGVRQLQAMKPTGRELNNCIIAWAGCLLGSECVSEKHQESFMAWCESPEARDVMNLEAMTMVARYSWKIKRETPEQYRLLWYQNGNGASELWYADKSEIQYSPVGSVDLMALEDSNLASTLRTSET